MLLAGLAAVVYATSTLLRLRADETANLADLVLATATGRIRWGLSQLWVAAGGASLLLATAGLSAGLGYGILTGSVSAQVPELLGAALARLPAVLVLAAVIAVFGPPLQWPAAMLDISPFTQTPKLPGGTVSAEPLLWLGGIALALTVTGLAGLRRRDIGDLGPSRPTGRVLDRLTDYVQESNPVTLTGESRSRDPW
jgi:ABC-2 type transport system permease protein